MSLQKICYFLFFVLSLQQSWGADSDVCLATLNNDIDNYGGVMNYVVSCDNDTFETKEIITGILIPFPYHWGKRARKILDKKMSSLSMNKIGTMSASMEYDVILYGSSDYIFNIDSFCTVTKFNRKVIGLNGDRMIFDAVINCSDNSIVEERLRGVEQSELIDYMSEQGLVFRGTRSAKGKMSIDNFIHFISEIDLFSK